MQVLYEDNHLLVVVKPAGLITQGAAADEASLVTQARDYLREKYHKPGNVYIGVVSRLDAAVSGVVVLARTSKAADRLTTLFRTRDVQKKYWAVVSLPPMPASGRCVDWLVKDERQQKVVVTRPKLGDAKEAVLCYTTKGKFPGGTLLEVELETGRKHQIRVQLATRGWPIIGDYKYGSPRPFIDGIALHARELCFEHPVKHEPLHFVAALPSSWKTLGVNEAAEASTPSNR